MKIDDAKKKLNAFAYHGKDRKALVKVCVDDGFAYATDGRIVFCAKLDEPAEREVTENFPLNGVKGYIEQVNSESVDKWYEVKDLKQFEDAFVAEYLSQRSRELQDMRGRYKEVRCPDCGRYVYWDTYNDELVSDMEEGDPFEPRNVDYAIKMTFTGAHGNDDAVLLINYGYLYTVTKELGYDILVSPQNKKENPVLFIKTKDGDIKGVMMPLRWYGSASTVESKCSINLVPSKEEINA